jgi:hypothetical protein
MKQKKCITPGCKNKANKGRKLCWTCKSRRKKEMNPLAYWYDKFKNNARRRNKEVTITLNDFKEFCNQTGYDKLKGRTANCLSIDRIDPSQGYHKDNIRAITVSDNSKRARGVLLDINDEWKMREEKCPF